MSEIKLNNEKYIEQLDSIKNGLFSINDYEDERYISLSSEEDRYMGESYTSSFYLKELMDNENQHVGFPEKYYSFPISNYVRVDKEKYSKIKDLAKVDFVKEIGAHTSALFNYYPPNGYVGWHTNWNAASAQILFTWSETGDGYFKYYSKKRNVVVTIKDVPGWQARWFVFGPKDGNESQHCWHCAFTKCKRITLAYKFTDLNNLFLLHDFIDELEEEK